jgi:exosortase O
MLSRSSRWANLRWSSAQREASWTAHLILLMAWLYFNLAPLQWIGKELLATSAFNLLLLSTGAGWLAWQGFRERQQFQPTGFKTNPWAGALLLASAVAAVALPHWLDLEHLAVFLGVLGLYGWLGLILKPSLWRQGFVLALLVALLLPFTLQQGTGLGFPVRVLTAQVVATLLHPLQIGLLSSQDVLVMENRIALVDLPCSGLKSLWTGGLFLLAASWLQKRQLGFRWLLVAMTTMGLLVIANISRVLTLVILTVVVNQPQLADIMHVPLSLFGFAVVCGISWWLLNWVPKAQASDRASTQVTSSGTLSVSKSRSWPQGVVLPLLLASMVLGLTALPQPIPAAIADLSRLDWPNHFAHQTLPLSSTETDFFSRHPHTQVLKEKFSYGGDTQPLSGSLLLVSSRSFRSQHSPELCFVGNGYEVNHLRAQQLAELPVHWLDLNAGQYTATYWFQSQHHTTADYLTRMWDQIRHRQAAWVMVSVVFDQPHQPQEPLVQEFARTLHQTLQNSSLASARPASATPASITPASV